MRLSGAQFEALFEGLGLAPGVESAGSQAARGGMMPGPAMTKCLNT